MKCLALPFLLLMAAAGSHAQPIDFGLRRELFVDRYVIEELRGVELRLHSPVKAPRAKSPLPEKHMVTVVKDGDRYRAWYRSNDPTYTGPFHSGHPGETVHYAESVDGQEWTFPTFQLHEFEGKKGNNVILAKLPPYLTDFMPFLDTRPGVDPAERYKAVAGYPGGGNKLGLKKSGIGLFGFVSPDGITWTKKNEIIPYRPEWRHAFDSPNVAFWSEAEQRYVCYFRTWTEPGRLRSISRATSPDFVNWRPGGHAPEPPRRAPLHQRDAPVCSRPAHLPRVADPLRAAGEGFSGHGARQCDRCAVYDVPGRIEPV